MASSRRATESTKLITDETGSGYRYAVESAAASVVALTSDVRGVCCWWVLLVVRFVCVPLCVRVFRVCPGSPRCLFTGT
jgi:hypothetical protein